MRFGRLALIPALAFAGCQTISPDAAGPTRVIHVASDYKSEGDCLYTKIDNFWHFGPSRHLDQITKTDLPAMGEMRFQQSENASVYTYPGWQVRVKRVSDKSSDVMIFEAPRGVFGSGAALYDEAIPRFAAECEVG
jgi:hypothetical protein